MNRMVMQNSVNRDEEVIQEILPLNAIKNDVEKMIHQIQLLVIYIDVFLNNVFRKKIKKEKKSFLLE